MPTPQALDQNLANLRKQKGLTLDALAEQSGVSRATISALENGSGNPRIDTIWNLANALGVEFGELVSGGSDTEVTDENGITVRLIDRQTSPQKIETYMMDLPAGARRDASAHPAGVTENIVVLAGTLAVGTNEHELQIAAGESHLLATDEPHFYTAGEQPSRSIVTVIYPKKHESSAVNNPKINQSDDEYWTHLSNELKRISLTVQNGCNYKQIRLSKAPQPESPFDLADKWPKALKNIKIPKMTRVYVAWAPQPKAMVFYRTPPIRPLPENSAIDTPLMKTCRKLAKAALLGPAKVKLNKKEIQMMSCGTESFVETALAKEALAHIAPSAIPKIKHSGIRGGDRLLDEIEMRIIDPMHSVPEWPCEKLDPGYARQMLAVAEILPASDKNSNQTLLINSDGSMEPRQMLQELRPELNVILLQKDHLSGNEESEWEVHNKNADYYRSSLEKYKPAHLFPAVVAIGSPANTGISAFLQQIHKWIKKGGLLIWVDEMLQPFSNEKEQTLGLIKHRVWRILDKLCYRPEYPTGREEWVAELLNKVLPHILYLAMSGDAESAVRRIGEAYLNIQKIHRETPIPWATCEPRGIGMDFFEAIEINKLAQALQNKITHHTYGERFVILAESCGFQLKKHERIYATDGDREWDAGTHLFVLEKQ